MSATEQALIDKIRQLPPQRLAEVEDFLADAFEADLSPMSALLESTPAMHENYGFSPATLDWEMWVGPAAWAPYHEKRCHWDWRCCPCWCACSPGSWPTSSV